MIIKLLLILLLTLGTNLFHRVEASPRSTTEKKISEYIVKQKNEQLSLLETLVNINSGTANISGVRHVGEILRPQFKQLGFSTKWVDEPIHMHKAPTLIAEHKGSTKNKLLLIGHLDTVFPKDSPFQKFEKHGNTATGPGIIDDKGGIVVILYALKALHATHALDDATITVVLTGDEEDSGKPTSISRKPLFYIAQNSNIALDFEWAITSDTAAIARRGIMLWTLHAEGKDAHSSELFRKSASYGAIFEVARIINTMLNQLSTEKYLSFNPGLILGGTTINYSKNTSHGTVSGKANVIAKTAMVKGDLRYLTPDQKANAKTKILNIVKQHLPGTTASIDFQDGIPSMLPTKNNLKLLEKYSQISCDLRYGVITPLDAGVRGAADISHIASIVSSNLAGLGALGKGAHSTHETLILDSLPIQTQRAALLIYRLTHEKKG
ncbi:MAG: M20/M25/M40 family metallo-hydrolase [Legionellaceae bacterium]|nr:M20/M25/M40 family metallo-hydrolase [Legionellaceae bacterium]